MLVWLTEYLSQFYSVFNVFSYVTMRTIMAALTALLIALILGPFMIRKLTDKQIGQTVRNDGPETHLINAGTPTMGGGLINNVTAPLEKSNQQRLDAEQYQARRATDNHAVKPDELQVPANVHLDQQRHLLKIP